MAQQDYNENQIQILEGLEAVRVRPGMYIGSTSIRGLHHCVYEIVDNAVDEALAGYCTDIEITINPDDTVTEFDNEESNISTGKSNILFLKSAANSAILSFSYLAPP